MTRAEEQALKAYPRADDAWGDEWQKRVGFVEGYKQAEKDLKEKAVEVEVFDDWQYGKDADRIAQPAIKLRCPELKIGQKVKVIIIKE